MISKNFSRNTKPRFVFLMALLPLTSLVGCSGEAPTVAETIRPVRALQIGEFMGISDSSRSLPGKARANQEVDLAFDVSGTLSKRPVNVGDSLKKGDLIAELDQRKFLSELKAAEAELLKANANFERAENLVSDGFISKVEFDTLKARRAVAEANLELAQKALTDTVIRAPYDGVIANLFVENYSSVQAKQQVARLLDNSSIEFVVDVSERYISMVRQVINPRVRFDSYPDREFPMTIKEIGTEASASSRTYPVVYTIEQPKDFHILPGMAGVAISDGIAGLDNGNLSVPVDAVFSPEVSEKTYVWVIDQQTQTVSRREVTVKSLADTGVIISNGLEVDEWIAIAGVHYLKEGMSVRLLEDASGG